MLQKSKTAGLKNIFSPIVLGIITNEIPLTIRQAYNSLLRHIRKEVLTRRIIALLLFTAVGCQQFCKESRKCQTKRESC